jgi:hypothetical protein
LARPLQNIESGKEKMKNYYKILEIEPTATLEQIKTQHRLMLHAWHPDKFPDGELKDKAEEKVREINEAYSILGDSIKRENYDRTLRASSNQSPQTPPPQSVRNTYSEPPKEHCESCGLPVETKYVEFYENVGMIIMRQHRSVKGKFCKSCIDYYFWNLTGKTMLLGWWGTISFIVTPFILLNNFLRFVFTMGMKKPPLSITPNPSPFWVFTAIGGILITGFFLFSTFCSVLTLPASSSYSPTSTARVVAPTRVPTKVKTPTPTSNCIKWSQVSSSMIGRQACVYGTIYKTQNVGNNFQVLFSSDSTDFFLATGTYYYEVTSGDCVVAEGEILRSGAGVPYINIDEALYQCESWMK